MSVLAQGLSWIDLMFLGRPHTIAAGIVQGVDTLAVVDPGPTTCLDALEQGLGQYGRRLRGGVVCFCGNINAGLRRAGASASVSAGHSGYPS